MVVFGIGKTGGIPYLCTIKNLQMKSDLRGRLIMGGMAIASAAGTLRAQGVVDVHSHNIPKGYVAVVESHGAGLEETFPLPDWDEEAHLRFMDEAGIGQSLLSMPAPQPWFGDADECRGIVRSYNEQSAGIRERHPGRFRFCASLPLPDVDAAVQEAIYALDSLKADAVKLATNSRGQYLGDPALEPLMQVLNTRKAIVILHPHRPVPVNEEIIGTSPLALYEYPAETTRALVNMMSHNVMARYPDIRWVIPHCGAFLPLALPRIKALLPAMVAAGVMEEVDFEANLANLYYDLAGAPTAGVIKSMLTITPPSHILYGSDYPYQPSAALQAGLERLRQTLSEDRELSRFADMFLHGNAEALFDK